MNKNKKNMKKFFKVMLILALLIIIAVFPEKVFIVGFIAIALGALIATVKEDLTRDYW